MSGARHLMVAVLLLAPAALAGPPEDAIGMRVEQVDAGFDNWCNWAHVTDIVTSRFYFAETKRRRAEREDKRVIVAHFRPDTLRLEPTDWNPTLCQWYQTADVEVYTGAAWLRLRRTRLYQLNTALEAWIDSAAEWGQLGAAMFVTGSAQEVPDELQQMGLSPEAVEQGIQIIAGLISQAAQQQVFDPSNLYPTEGDNPVGVEDFLAMGLDDDGFEFDGSEDITDCAPADPSGAQTLGEPAPANPLFENAAPDMVTIEDYIFQNADAFSPLEANVEDENTMMQIGAVLAITGFLTWAINHDTEWTGTGGDFWLRDDLQWFDLAGNPLFDDLVDDAGEWIPALHYEWTLESGPVVRRLAVATPFSCEVGGGRAPAEVVGSWVIHESGPNIPPGAAVLGTPVQLIRPWVNP